MLIELDYRPYEYQAEFHDSGKRFTVIVGGRRVGKSRMALQDLVKHCLEQPNAEAWWVAPTIGMAREVGWEEFHEMEDDLAPALENVNSTLMRVRFKNGAVLYFKGGDNERSLRGRGLTYVVVDEAAFLQPEIWSRALLPALADKKGKALLISTPNGRNWFYDLASYAANQPIESEWSFHHWPSPMNPLLDDDELHAIANSVSEMDFRQEFLAEFVTRAGMVYDEFSEENIIQEFSPDTRDFNIYLGVDFGFANPTAIAFMAVEIATQRVFQFDEVYVARMKVEEIEGMIVSQLSRHDLYPNDVRFVYTDPAGNAVAPELSQGVSPVDYLRMSPLKWRVINKKSFVAPGLALVRSYIRAATGERRFFVTQNCGVTINSIIGYAYDSKAEAGTIKEEPIKDGKHDHMCDAVRYFFVNYFDQSKWVAEDPETFMYGAEDRNKISFKRCQACRKKFPSRTPPKQPPFLCKECEIS